MHGWAVAVTPRQPHARARRATARDAEQDGWVTVTLASGATPTTPPFQDGRFEGSWPTRQVHLPGQCVLIQIGRPLGRQSRQRNGGLAVQAREPGSPPSQPSGGRERGVRDASRCCSSVPIGVRPGSNAVPVEVQVVLAARRNLLIPSAQIYRIMLGNDADAWPSVRTPCCRRGSRRSPR